MTVIPAVKRRRLSPSDASGAGSSPSTLVAQSDGPGPDDFFTRAAGWNLEQDYEQRPRKKKKNEKENTRLPIKTAEGRIEPLQVTEVKDEDQDSWLSSGEDEDRGQNTSVVVKEEVSTIPIRQQIIEAQEELARVASLINEDPEEHVGGLKTLAQIAASMNPTIKKLALATQLVVFKDVIPGYRIRPIAEADQTDKVSKDVRRLRAFEQTLVASYQNYLKDLAKCAKPSSGETSEPLASVASVASVAISCACALLLAVPHFNFRGELLKILVAKLSGRRIDSEYNKCRESMEVLFRNDEDGTSSLDAVKMVTSMMKARGYRVDESLLNTFLHLRLLSEFSSKGSQNHIDKAAKEEGKKPKFKKEFRTKKQRKLLKERKVVEKEFKEADAVVSHEERDRMQAETLKLVFVTYFRILKARSPNLMGAVLEGLAKYAHLINQNFFGDLLETLKDLITDADTLLNTDPENEEQDQEDAPFAIRDATRESFLCIITAFALLEGQDASRAASGLSLDLTFFTTHLYKTLYALSMHPDLELNSKSLRLPDPHSASPTPTASNKVNLQTTTVLLLRSLNSILAPRIVPPLRLAAFTKQLFTSSLQLPEKSTLATFGLLQNVTKTHGRKIAALWNTEERRGDGVFDPLRGDLEGSNPFAGTVWEGELLRLHYCPGVREAARRVEKTIGEVK